MKAVVISGMLLLSSMTAIPSEEVTNLTNEDNALGRHDAGETWSTIIPLIVDALKKEDSGSITIFDKRFQPNSVHSLKKEESILIKHSAENDALEIIFSTDMLLPVTKESSRSKLEAYKRGEDYFCTALENLLLLFLQLDKMSLLTSCPLNNEAKKALDRLKETITQNSPNVSWEVTTQAIAQLKKHGTLRIAGIFELEPGKKILIYPNSPKHWLQAELHSEVASIKTFPSKVYTIYQQAYIGEETATKKRLQKLYGSKFATYISSDQFTIEDCIQSFKNPNTATHFKLQEVLDNLERKEEDELLQIFKALQESL